MAKRDILKEAIADAKAVKETAIANAKAALEEAFTPQLKSMLATKLEEMELEEEEEKVNEMADSKYEEDDKVKEGMDSKYEEDDKVKEGKEEKEMEEGMSYSSYEEDDQTSMEENLDEEIDLDEILAELEGELNEEKEEKEVKEEEISETEEPVSEDERTDAEEEGFLDGKKDGEEDEEIDLEDMTDDDLKGFIEDVIADMVASGELEAGENFEEEGEEEVDVEDEVDVEISEAKKKDKDEEEKDKKEKVDEAEIAEIYKEVERLRESNKALKSELNKSFSTVDTLQEDLNEVNLLNAKLLYTNKIFKAKTLTESQKVKVLGAFDKANTVKETKLVFETLNDGLKAKKKSPITESLGAASRVSRSVNAKKPIIETDPMVARFQKLAGLK